MYPASVWEPHFSELRRYNRETGEDELLLWELVGAADPEASTGNVGTPATLADGSIVVPIREPGESGSRLVRFVGEDTEEWLGAEHHARLLQRVGNDAVLVTGLFDGTQRFALIEGGEATLLMPDEETIVVQAEPGMLLVRDNETECALWRDGAVRRPDISSVPRSGTWPVGFLPDGSVLLRTDEGMLSWDGEDGTAPEAIGGLPGNLGDPIFVPGTGAVAMLERVGDDGFEQPGFLEDGAWTACNGPAIDELHTYMLFDDPEMPGIVYNESSYDQPNDGTLYICTPDGEVTALEHPTARLRVLGDSLNPGDW